MPIRVVLKEASKTPFPIGISEAPSSPVSVSSNAGSRPRRSSILRPTTEQLIRKSEMPITDDISVSSRLSGYLFTFISYLVLLVSTTLSYDIIDEEMESDKITKSKWKQDMTLFGSVTFLGLTFFIILVHFDTWLFPKFWRRVFCPGSKWEGMILISTMLLSLSIVFASTSSDGLGGVAALNYNVYILSWLGLVLTIYTFNLWLVSGGKPTLHEYLLSARRNTTMNWTYTLIFSFITFLSLLDVFVYADGYDSLKRRSNLVLSISTASSVVCCMFVLLMNRLCTETCSCISVRLEGFLSLAMCALWTWIVFRFTGVNGIVNGPSNSYFGIWGTFYYSINTFGMYLKDYRRHWQE